MESKSGSATLRMSRTLVIFLMLFHVKAWAQTSEFTFAAFDVPGALSTVAFGINDAGQIVGRGVFPPASAPISLLSNAWTTPARIALFHFNNSTNQIPTWALRPWLRSTFW
jgi:hypothetical protein